MAQEVKIDGLCFHGIIEEVGDAPPNFTPQIIVRDNYGNKIAFDCSREDCMKVGHRLYDDVIVSFNAAFIFSDITK